MIVLITESLLQRSTATDGRILRDRFLQGFCVRLNKRKHTFLVAPSVRGKQFRMMLGYWPLMSLDEARSKAMEILRQCRNGERPSRQVPQDLPTIREVYVAYCVDKGIKPSSQRRYESFFRTHFGDWLDQSVDQMGHGAFAEHFQKLLTEQGITCSMSRAGEVWDNSAMESFFSALKIERVHRKVYRTRAQSRADVFDFIEAFYNPKRRHSTIGYISPVKLEEALFA